MDQLAHLINDKRIVLVDEVQRIAGIGVTLKMITDHFPVILPLQSILSPIKTDCFLVLLTAYPHPYRHTIPIHRSHPSFTALLSKIY